MEPMLIELPTAWSEHGDDSGECHLYCCDPDVALCGTVLTGEEQGDDEPVDCFSCVAIDEAGVPCQARFCRLRSWWRLRRSS